MLWLEPACGRRNEWCEGCMFHFTDMFSFFSFSCATLMGLEAQVGIRVKTFTSKNAPLKPTSPKSHQLLHQLSTMLGIS